MKETLYWIVMAICTLLVLIFPMIIAHKLDKRYGDRIDGLLALGLFIIIACEIIAGMLIGYFVATFDK